MVTKIKTWDFLVTNFYGNAAATDTRQHCNYLTGEHTRPEFQVVEPEQVDDVINEFIRYHVEEVISLDVKVFPVFENNSNGYGTMNLARYTLIYKQFS